MNRAHNMANVAPYIILALFILGLFFAKRKGLYILFSFIIFGIVIAILYFIYEGDLKN